MTERNEQFFDKSEVYKTEIAPLLEQAREKMKEHNIPFVISACFANSKEEADVQYSCNLIGNATPKIYYAVDIVLENRTNDMVLGLLFATQSPEQ